MSSDNCRFIGIIFFVFLFKHLHISFGEQLQIDKTDAVCYYLTIK